MAKFKVDDIVVGNDETDKLYGVTRKGVKCKVICVCDGGSLIKVEVAEGVFKGREYCVLPKHFDLASSEEITIKRYGNKVVAKCGDKTAVAKCSPEDTFDFATGAKLAFERLFEKPLLNTKICIIDGDEDFQTGRIYEVVNGKITNRSGAVLPYNFALRSIEELYDYFLPKEERMLHREGWGPRIKFVEVKE